MIDRCLDCESYYYDLTSDGLFCNLKSLNCQEFDSLNVCIKCLSGFYLSNGLCSQPIDYCSAYDEASPEQPLCKICLDDYSLSSNKVYL